MELGITVLFPQGMLHYLTSVCFTDLKIKSLEIWKELGVTDNSCFFLSLQFLRIIPFSPAEESPDIFIFLTNSKWSRALARLFDYQMNFWLGMNFRCSLPVVFSLSSFTGFLCPLSLTDFSLSLHCFMSCTFPLSKTNTIPDNFSVFTLWSHSTM